MGQSQRSSEENQAEEPEQTGTELHFTEDVLSTTVQVSKQQKQYTGDHSPLYTHCVVYTRYMRRLWIMLYQVHDRIICQHLYHYEDRDKTARCQITGIATLFLNQLKNCTRLFHDSDNKQSNLMAWKLLLFICHLITCILMCILLKNYTVNKNNL